LYLATTTKDEDEFNDDEDFVGEDEFNDGGEF
jgi:hypothetical protein